MREFMLNPLSPLNQCVSDAGARTVIRNVLECFEHLNVLVANRRGLIYFDERMEGLSLGPVDAIGVAIAKMMNTPDSELARKWYVYRRRLTPVQPPDCAVEMRSIDVNCLDVASGDVSEQVLNPGLSLFSFGGGALTESPNLAICSAATRNTVPNHHRIDSLKASLPFYRASPKHGKKKYFDRERKEWVAPMTLPSDIAQEVLSLAVLHEGDYFGYHLLSGKIVRFKLTRGNEYHGFEIEESELPSAVAHQVLPAR